MLKTGLAERGETAPPASHRGLPIWHRPVVVVKPPFPIAVDAPGLVEAGLADRSAAQLLIREVELVGIEALVVPQHAPRQRAIFLADAEKTAKGHHRIGNLAAALID